MKLTRFSKVVQFLSGRGGNRVGRKAGVVKLMVMVMVGWVASSQAYEHAQGIYSDSRAARRISLSRQN